MGITLCARLKKSRQSRSSFPSDIAATYQLSRTESPQDGAASETPSSIECSPCPTMPKRPLSEGQALSLSGRLRRRFSRDNRRPKSIHFPHRPRRSSSSSDRQQQQQQKHLNGLSIFSLSSRLSRLAPLSAAASGAGGGGLRDLGAGSLTSDKGYDSDAQYISSPRNMTLCRSPVPSSRQFSPLLLDHGYARTELSDLSERSNERFGDGSGPVVEQSDGLDGVCDGLGRSGREGSLALDGADTKSVDQSTSEAVVEDLSQPIQSEAGSSTVSNEPQEEEGIVHIVPEPQSPTPVESDENDSHCPSVLPSRRDQRIASWSCDTGTDTKSVDSWRRHGSEILAPKRRQQPRSLSGRSLHLGDMNIPQALASPSLISPSITPLLLSQNRLVEENRQDDMPGSRSVSESSGIAKLESSLHQRERSFYSPRSSTSSAPSGYHPMPKTWGHSGIEKYLNKLDRQAGTRSLDFDGPGSYSRAHSREASESSAAEISNAATQALRSRYKDDFENNAVVDDVGPGEAGHGQTPCVRRVSAGWMSGGRRIGYGYSMVPPDEKENPASRAESRSTSGAAYGSSVSVNTLPSMISCLSQRRLSGTAASPKAPAAKEPTDGDSVSSPIWARVANRMKGRNSSASNSTRTMPGHWPISGPERGHSPPKRTSVLENKEGSLLHRMTRIYSASSLQTRRRNATDNMHDIKERFSAKASGIYQPLLQRKASGDFRLRDLSRAKGRVHYDGATGPSPLKNCGWTRADRSANWLEVPAATTGDGRKVSEQIGSDDTTEELVYQDCLEDMPV